MPKEKERVSYRFSRDTIARIERISKEEGGIGQLTSTEVLEKAVERWTKELDRKKSRRKIPLVS